jgi:hypothetical protein
MSAGAATAASHATELLANQYEAAGVRHAHALGAAASRYTGLGATVGAALLDKALGMRVKWAPAPAPRDHSSSLAAGRVDRGMPMGMQVEVDDHVLYALGITLLLYFLAYLYLWLPPLLLPAAMQPT